MATSSQRHHESFEELLRAIRGNDDLAALARDTNVSLFWLQQLRSGLSQPHLAHLRRIATILEVPHERVSAAVAANRARRGR